MGKDSNTKEDNLNNRENRYNFIYLLHEKLTDKKPYLGKVIFFVIPFLYIVVIYLIMLYKDVLLFPRQMGMSFMRDTSNSVCMMAFFVFSFYLLYIIPPILENGLKYIQTYLCKEDQNRNFRNFFYMPKMNIALCVMAVVGIFPVIAARKVTGSWTSYFFVKDNILSYLIFLALYWGIWYLSLLLLTNIAIGLYLYAKLLSKKSPINIKVENKDFYDFKKGMRAIAKALGVMLSWIVMYVLIGLMIIANDFLRQAESYKIKCKKCLLCPQDIISNSYEDNSLYFFAAHPIWVILLALIIVLGVCVMVISIRGFYTIISTWQENEINRIDKTKYFYNKKSYLIKKIHTVDASVMSYDVNKWAVLGSLVVPAVQLVIQLIIGNI